VIQRVELIAKLDDAARRDAVQGRLLPAIVARVDNRVRLEW